MDDGFLGSRSVFYEFEDLNPPSTLGEYHGGWLYDWLKRCREKQVYDRPPEVHA